MNRIAACIVRQEQTIATLAKAHGHSAAKLEQTRKALDMSLSEYVRFQEIKSLAVANGTLTLEEGQTVYAYLGETVDHFNQQPLPVKASLTKLFAELLQRKGAK